MAQGWECSSARETPRGEHRGERSRPNRRQWGRRAEGRGGHRGQSCAQLRSPSRKARSHSVNKECDRDKMVPNQGQTQLHVQFNPTWDRQDTASSKANWKAGLHCLPSPPSGNNTPLIPDVSYQRQQPGPCLPLLLEWLKP